MKGNRESVRDLTFEDLLERYGRLMLKYCRYSIDGYTHDDIYQELCIVLHRCQFMWDPTHPSAAKFSTYFVNAMKWKIGNILFRATKRMGVWCALDDEDDERVAMLERLFDPDAEIELDDTIFRLDLAKLSLRAQERCRKIMAARRLQDITFRVGDGALVREIRNALVGYNSR